MNTAHFEAWREAFLNTLQESDYAAPLKSLMQFGHWNTAIISLTETIIESCQRLGWLASANQHRRSEFTRRNQTHFDVDVVAFPESADVGRWRLPVAVFEFGNSDTPDRTDYSLWKVLSVQAQLRVVFDFKNDWTESSRIVERLVVNVGGSLSPEELLRIASDTVFVVGNRGGEGQFPEGYFNFWRLNPISGRFEQV